MLVATSQIDDASAAIIKAETDLCDAACAAGNWTEAINAWGATEGLIDNLAHGVDFYVRV